MDQAAPSTIFRLARAVYAGLYYPALPLLGYLRRKRLKAGKEVPERLNERKGAASIARPNGRVLWIHGASVGETLSALPLIDALLDRFPSLSIVVTTVTTTSAKLLDERLPARAVHQFVPIDHRPWVRRFLDHWRPDGVLWLESEFWPTTIGMIKARGIPLVLVNGRVSPASYRRWRYGRWFVRGILRHFDVCMAQSRMDAGFLKNLGARNVEMAGNLKLAAPPLPVDERALQSLDEAIGDQPRILLSSSHDGEEELLIGLHRELAGRWSDLLTVIAPRHPERGARIGDLGRAAGIRTRLRSNGEPPDGETGLYVADTIGELGLFYRLCPIVLIGKSLSPPGGGQNPFEPVKLGRAVIFGPYMDNFVEIAQEMVDAGAAIRVDDIDHLRLVLSNLLAEPNLLEQRTAAANDFCRVSNSIIDDTIDVITKVIRCE